MKITYEFVTGEVSEVEVDERLGGMLLDLNRQQENNDRKETRRHFSLNGMDYEGELFASAEGTEREAERREVKWYTKTGHGGGRNQTGYMVRFYTVYVVHKQNPPRNEQEVYQWVTQEKNGWTSADKFTTMN